jgi:uncharacterized integral membrane protein (TIGR00697 family)
MKDKRYFYLSILTALYCAFTCTMNLFDMKTIGTSTFAFGGCGVLMSWAVFMIMDIATEVYGEKESIRIYTIAGIINLLIVLLAQIAIALPGVYPEQNSAFAQIFSNGPRTAISSFIAFWCGNYVNVHIMAKMKAKSKDDKAKLSFFSRAVVSTIFGQFVDDMLFATLAFAPIGLSLFEMTWKDIFTRSMIGVFNETVIEMLFVPFITIPVSNKLKRMFAED